MFGATTIELSRFARLAGSGTHSRIVARTFGVTRSTAQWIAPRVMEQRDHFGRIDLCAGRSLRAPSTKLARRVVGGRDALRQGTDLQLTAGSHPVTNQRRDRPRVVHVVPSLFSREEGIVGGAERYVYELARHMARRVPTSLVTFGAQPREFRAEELRVRVIAPHYAVKGQATNPISHRIVTEIAKADVVHCHQQHILVSSIAAITARFLRKRVVVTDLGGGGWDFSAYVSTDRWYHAHLHISEYSRSIFGQSSRRNAHVILGGVDTEQFSPASDTSRNGRILFVGRILPHKGLLDLVDAAGDDLPLDIVGQPYDLAFLELLKRRAGAGNVTFHHDRDDAFLVEAYRRCLCVVLPSVYKAEGYPRSSVPELLGQTLIEGMACGAPAVCTDVASLPEVVVDGVTGFVVPPNDPAALRSRLAWLVEHPDDARAMGIAGRQRVLQRFTWDTVVARCLEVYERPAGRSIHGTENPSITHHGRPDVPATGRR